MPSSARDTVLSPVSGLRTGKRKNLNLHGSGAASGASSTQESSFENEDTDVPDLIPAIVNGYIGKIIVYAPDKSGGHCRQKPEGHS